MRRLFIYGFPGLYGGASTELHHQFFVWKQLNIELHLIPTNAGYKGEPLYPELLEMGVIIHGANDFAEIKKDDVLINFCSGDFLDNLDAIRRKTNRTAFVNCMTWLFDKEKAAHAESKIAFSLYQRTQVLESHKEQLQKLGSKGKFLHFSPYFESARFPFSYKDDEFSWIGRISRQDSDKFTKNLFYIWDRVVSPKMKRGIVLGFDKRSQAKTGNPPDWVTAHVDQGTLSVQDFWKSVDIIVQPTETTENWPRIGFEAMYSGVPLVVDNKGGWKYLIEHGKSGFLCDHERDFMYYGSKLFYEPAFRKTIANNALKRAIKLSGMETSLKSWKKTLDILFDSDVQS